MTAEELNRVLDERERRGRRPVTGPAARRGGPDWKGWIGLSLGVLAALAAFTLFVFKTNAAADLEHSEIRATHSQDTKVHSLLIDQHAATQKMMVEEVVRNGRNLLRIGDKLKAKGLEDPNGDDE